MNISKNTHKPIYICDKCNKRIEYTYRQGIKVYKYYKYNPKSYVPKKDFDLCAKCEKEFRKWLKEDTTTDTISIENLIDSFEVFDKWEEEI